MLKSLWIALTLLTILNVPAAAQEDEKIPKIEIFGGYSLLRTDKTNFAGWKTAVSFNIKRWFALAVDADGHYSSRHVVGGKLKEREHSLTAGPHFAYRNKSRVVPFAYVMTGVAWESESLAGMRHTSTGLAVETGGGIDVELNHRIAIRVIDISASITQIDGHRATKPKFSTGLVLHFGER